MQSLWLRTTRMLVVMGVMVLALCFRQGQALYTFSCDGQFLSLQCPARNVLFIRSAMFGKKPGTHYRCGETTRATKGCETDITQFMKYKCEGLDYCRVHVEIATFSLETFCQDFIKYAEVYFDCVPYQRMQGVQSCLNQCLPPPVPVYSRFSANTYGAQTMGPTGSFSVNNAVVPSSHGGAASGQPGVIYTQPGGPALQASSASLSPSSSSSLSSSSSSSSAGGAGAGAAAEPKGFGSPPANSPPGASHVGNGAGPAPAGGPGGPGGSGRSGGLSRFALMARIGQMMGAMRSGRVG